MNSTIFIKPNRQHELYLISWQRIMGSHFHSHCPAKCLWKTLVMCSTCGTQILVDVDGLVGLLSPIATLTTFIPHSLLLPPLLISHTPCIHYGYIYTTVTWTLSFSCFEPVYWAWPKCLTVVAGLIHIYCLTLFRNQSFP